MQQRLADAAVKLDGGQVQTSPAATAQPATVKPVAKKPSAVTKKDVAATSTQPAKSKGLSRNAAYKIKKITKSASSISGQVEKYQMKHAKKGLQKLEAEYQQLITEIGQSVPNSHQEMVQLNAAMSKVRADYAAVQKQLKAMGGSLDKVFAVADQTLPALEKAIRSARGALDGLSAVKSGENPAQRIAKNIQAFQQKQNQVNEQLPAAMALVTSFNEKLEPKMPILLRMFQDGSAASASAAVSKTANLIDIWTKLIDREMAAIVKNSKEGIDSANKALAKGAPNASKKHSIQSWVIDQSAPLLDVLPVAYQTTEENSDAFLKYNPTRRSLRESAQKYQIEIASLAKNLAFHEAAAKLQAEQKIDSARFPNEGKKASGSDKQTLDTAFAKKFGATKPIKMHIYSPWTKRTEARWINDHWDVGTFNYIGVWVAKQTVSGKYRVYRMNFRQRQQADGNGVTWPIGVLVIVTKFEKRISDQSIKSSREIKKWLSIEPLFLFY